MFGYPDLDAGLNTLRFLKVIASPKPMRHSTLNNRDSGLETMAIMVVDLVVYFRVLAMG